jgi:DtxR family Mn-dependent transcriptional regulator
MTDYMPRGSVAGMDVDSISAVAQDYVKAIWSATEWGDPPITTKALAARFGTSAANVTDTMRRLAAQGLIDYQPYKPVQLTTRGTALAVTMVRRHRLIETFLVTTLGYRWDEIHDEAERLEHAATDLLINRIDTLLGHPTADPHGDPIPTANGQPRPVSGAVRLSTAGPGRHLIHRISDADPANLHTAGNLGITPGTIIETAGAGGSLTISTPQGVRAIPEAVAHAIWTTTAS